MQNAPSGRHAVIVFYALMAVLVVILLRFPPQNSAEVAAWVQGVGTLAAVGAAIWAGLFPAMRSARQERSARAEFAQDVTDVLDLAEKAVARVVKAVEAGDYRRAATALDTIGQMAIQPSIADLLATPRARWPSRQCYGHMFMLNRMLAVLAGDEAAAAAPGQEADRLAYLGEQLDVVVRVMESAREEIGGEADR
ncbi:hypothetical protein [Phenylobacterium sp.]|uniref:hypothetical protein n=1 Tax=Phenylobacterium sp. TaxID=1871053 RepID=UPI0028A12C49|nr:hypothetical protein [Phenylobacterium sp.]